MPAEKQHAHELIDRLAPSQVAALFGLLEVMLDPAGEEEERAVAEARQWLRDNGGKGIPHEEVLADFGLTTEDFHRMGERRAGVRRIDRQMALSLLEDLADYALDGHGDVERLHWIEPPELRLRIGDYRVPFYDHGDCIQIFRVLHRRGAYR